MTLDLHSSGIPADRPDPERPTDPRPAWERIAYTWLAREVDGGQPVDPTVLAAEVSVAPDLARDLLRLLRAQRTRDPGLSELRARLVRDRISDAYLRRELAGTGRLDPTELAAEVGTSPAVARQWLAGLRAQQPGQQGLELLSEPVSHGRPTPEQLAGLQAHFASGGHQHAASAAARATPSGWGSRSNATTGLGRSAPVSGSGRARLRGSSAATSGRSASSSPSCAPGHRAPASGSRNSGASSSKTLAVGRSAPVSSPGGWGSPTATCGTSPGSSAPARGSRRLGSGWPLPTSSSLAHHRSGGPTATATGA